MSVKLSIKLDHVKKMLSTIRSDTSLTFRIIRGSIWLGTGSGVDQCLRFVRNMILARLLMPESFGIMAIILAVNSAFESFTEIGIKEAIIQNPKSSEHTFINMAWWLSFCRSIFLFAVVFGIAPLIASIYESPQLSDMLRLSSFSIIINGMISSQAYVALKQMKYKHWISILTGSSIFGVCTAIFLALTIKNVWALIIALIVEALVRCILSFVVCPFLPKFKYEKDSMSFLLKYAKKMFGLPILTFIYLQTDIFVVGKLFSKNDLGLYSMALSLAQLPTIFISAFINPLLIPAFSEIQPENDRINRAILKTTSLLLLLGVPIFFFVSLYSQEILTLVYGSQYQTIAIPFIILFASALMRTCSAPIATVYIGTGRPELHRLFTSVRAISMIAIIYPAVEWFGLTGAATAGLLATLIAYVLQIMRMRQITGLDVYQYSSIFPRAIGLSFPVIVVWIITYNFFPFHPIIDVLTGILGCIVSFSFLATSPFRS